MSAPLVYVVVLNYRNYTDTIECVRSLRHADYPNFKILVIENGSDNDSEARLREALPDQEILQTGKNLGYSGGNNVGLERALHDGAEFALILNNDTVVDSGFITALVECALNDPTAGVLGAVVLKPDGTIAETCVRRRPPLREIFWDYGPGRWFRSRGGRRATDRHPVIEVLDRPREVEVVSGACMMLRTSMLKRIGLLDDRSFLFLEEFILAEKLRGTGFKSMVVPASRVRHEGGKSTKTMPVRQALYFLQSLNLYLRHYRRVGAVRRFLVLCGPAVFFIPSILKTVMGLRRPH